MPRWVLLVVVGCSACLFPSLDNLTSGDAGADASAHDASADGVSGEAASDAAMDAPGAADVKQDAPDLGWKTLAVVQVMGSTGPTTVSLHAKTLVGTLLVAMEPSTDPPSGGGWTTISSSNGDAMFIWPNNPGNLETFTLSGGNQDIILIEFSGAPASVSKDFEDDSMPKGSNVSTLQVTGPVPKQVGELVLTYIDTNSATTANPTVSGWASLGTDNNNNFAWWLAATVATPVITVDFTPATPASLMMVGLKSP